jgi:hypothetical protein
MPRSHQCGARITGSLAAQIDIEPLLIYRDWNHGRARTQEHFDPTLISRIFHPNPIAGLQCRTRNQIQPLMHPRRHDDLFGDAIYATRGAYVFRDRLPQRAITGDVACRKVPDG